MKYSNVALIALGDPTRQEIVEILSRGPSPVNRIAEKFSISRPAISKHLKILVTAGLITHEERGTENIYRLREDGFDSVRNYLDRLWDVALRRYQILAENTKARIS